MPEILKGEQRFGRYHLLSLIGRGGMAELFRARLETPAGAEKILVVKRILPSFSSDPEFLKMFVNEARIALPLTHGNITSVFEFGEVEGQYFLAMEFIHGQNLYAVLERLRETAIRMPIPVALFVASEIGKGLSYAHGFTTMHGQRAQVVHLDVTPHNILVSYDGAVKLTDFGIAKLKATAEPSFTVLRGKVRYLAPEQAEGRAVDARTDIFQLGVVLYEMLTGVTPYEARTDHETLDRLRAGDVEPPSAHLAELADLDEIVLKAIAHDPNDRYKRAADFQIAVNQALFRRSSEYGSFALAEWLRDLFAWDIFEQQSDGTDPGLRDRLLFQLTNAKVEIDPEKPTREIIAVRTVSIPPPPPAPPPISGAEQTKRVMAVAWKAALFIVVAIGVAFGVGKSLFSKEVAELAPKRAEAQLTVASLDASSATPASGRLSLNAWPSAIVYLNGERIPGITPILNHLVPEGRHKLLFVRPELDLRKEIEVVVPAGSEKTVIVTLDH
jgi:eukaryotic-like serine/threonine-protein kinase